MSNPNEEAAPPMASIDPTAASALAMSSSRWEADLLRQALPACQPQEGSPANTFTSAERAQLQPFLAQPCAIAGASNSQRKAPPHPANQMDILEPWTALEPTGGSSCQTTAEPSATGAATATDQPPLDWYGAPRVGGDAASTAQAFRQAVRRGDFTGPTNGVCPGFLQCNLVILPAGPDAFDFLLFCQRNPQACPLLEVCDTGSPHPRALAADADVRTDCPKYAVYRHGVLVEEVTDITAYWPEDAVAFLIGCSFSYDGALQEAGIPLRSAEAGRNVPMYTTSLPCRTAGRLHGNIVVSMKPIPALQVAQHVAITAQYPHAHGAPLCIDRPALLGIADLDQPDWGDSVPVRPDEVAVFHACGVTPQAVLLASKLPFAITHAPGHMFVTDRPSDLK